MLLFVLAPEMVRLHFYFSESCLNGLLGSLNVCLTVWSFLIHLKSQNKETLKRPLVVGRNIAHKTSLILLLFLVLFYFSLITLFCFVKASDSKTTAPAKIKWHFSKI